MRRSLAATTRVLYIKLGASGAWESDCIREGSLRIGYQDLPHELCLAGEWPALERKALEFSKDKGAATRHINQVRQFYEAPQSTLWVTFHAGQLWWCFGGKQIRLLPDLSKTRRAIGGWKATDLNGKHLLKSSLSGKLLATESFQGTICSISERAYLLHRINGTVEPRVAAAQQALEALVESLIPIIKKLQPKDLELLTDLIFRQSGWTRVGVVGGTTKDIDLDLISPITRERLAVQVKSRADVSDYDNYRARFADMRSFSRFYFVTHSPTPKLALSAAKSADQSFVFWGPSEIAAHVARNGLTGWLLDKAG